MKVKTLSEIYWTDVHALCICLCISVLVFVFVLLSLYLTMFRGGAHTRVLYWTDVHALSQIKDPISHKISYTALWKNHRAVQRTGSKDKGGTYTWHGHMVDGLLRDLLPTIQSCDQCNNLWFIMQCIHTVQRSGLAWEIKAGHDSGLTSPASTASTVSSTLSSLSSFLSAFRFWPTRLYHKKDIESNRLLKKTFRLNRYQVTKVQKNRGFFWDILLQPQ